MFISQELKEKNIAEYLLYMWQIEDLIRANGCDMDRIRRGLIAAFTSLSAEQRGQLETWYENLIEMMRHEGVMETGHLQINKNIILLLNDLHLGLLRSPKAADYNAAYYKVLPYIVELRAKSGGQEVPEPETCLEALYGVILLRLQHKPVSAETERAIQEITRFVALLSDYYNKERRGELNDILEND